MSRSPGVLVEVIPLGAFGDFVMDGDRLTLSNCMEQSLPWFSIPGTIPNDSAVPQAGTFLYGDRSSARMVMQACYLRKVPLFSGCPDGS
ncbi:hypothetical protein [Laspinema palackyanum]|uniref:hypothetical protein n=1 Tax=Laspinema palackyanum TaxID=3231601 RepID=UPI00345D38A3|nr:hypothetical protein [Laspinema sp. D2c]